MSSGEHLYKQCDVNLRKCLTALKVKSGRSAYLPEQTTPF